MNAVSAALIPKVYSVGHSDNPLTQAALIAAGMVSGNLSNSAVQDAIASVSRYAASSENPEAWIAAFLADMAVNGVPGSGSASGVLTSLMRIAPSSENPAVWIAAFLSDMAANGLPGGGAAPEPGPVPVSFTDTFDRANADPMSQPVTGTWTSGPGGFGPCKIVGNALEASTAAAYCGARVLAPLFDPDQKATVTLGSLLGSPFMGPCVRMQTSVSGSCYHLMTGGSGAVLRLYKVTDSTATTMVLADFVQLGADIIPSPVLISGDTISLEVIGSTLNVYQGALLIATRSDATWATGQPGIHVYGGGGNTIAAFGSESGGGGGGGALTLGDMVIGSSFTVS